MIFKVIIIVALIGRSISVSRDPITCKSNDSQPSPPTLFRPLFRHIHTASYRWSLSYGTIPQGNQCHSRTIVEILQGPGDERGVFVTFMFESRERSAPGYIFTSILRDFHYILAPFPITWVRGDTPRIIPTRLTKSTTQQAALHIPTSARRMSSLYHHARCHVVFGRTLLLFPRNWT